LRRLIESRNGFQKALFGESEACLLAPRFVSERCRHKTSEHGAENEIDNPASPFGSAACAVRHEISSFKMNYPH
jgi:hypothetical protein